MARGTGGTREGGTRARVRRESGADELGRDERKEMRGGQGRPRRVGPWREEVEGCLREEAEEWQKVKEFWRLEMESAR